VPILDLSQHSLGPILKSGNASRLGKAEESITLLKKLAVHQAAIRNANLVLS
jgi:hypothetical protein